MEANRRTTKACRLIVCGIPLSCFALDNYRVPIKILLEGHVCWRKWARSKPRQVRSLAKLASNRPSPLSLPLSSSLHEAVALLFFFSFSIEPRVKRNTRRKGKDSFFHSRIRFKYIYRKKRENVYEGYLDSVEGSLERRKRSEGFWSAELFADVGVSIARLANEDVAILQSSACYQNCHPPRLGVA